MVNWKRWAHLAAVKLGISNAKIFGYNPPYPNPHGFEKTDGGCPIVPDERVFSNAWFEQTPPIFSGGLIYSGDPYSETFQVRKAYGGPSLNTGDMFAYENSDPSRPALVYEVTEVENGGNTLIAQDVGFLKSSLEEAKARLEADKEEDAPNAEA